MAQLPVKQVCEHCEGTGLMSYSTGHGGDVEEPCTWQGCDGGVVTLGYVEVDFSTSALQDKHDDILEKLEDVLELLQE